MCTGVCVRVCTRGGVRPCVCQCVCVCTRIRERVCVCQCTYVGMCVRTFTCVCASVHSCVCVYLCVHGGVCHDRSRSEPRKDTVAGTNYTYESTYTKESRGPDTNRAHFVTRVRVLDPRPISPRSDSFLQPSTSRLKRFRFSSAHRFTPTCHVGPGVPEGLLDGKESGVPGCRVW